MNRPHEPATPRVERYRVMAIRTQESLSGFSASDLHRTRRTTPEVRPLPQRHPVLRLRRQAHDRTPRDKTGDRYEYFTCSGQRRKTTNCTRSAILAERAEAEIERTYQRNSPTETQARQARSRTPQTHPSPPTPTRSPSTCSRTNKNASEPASTRSPSSWSTSTTSTPSANPAKRRILN